MNEYIEWVVISKIFLMNLHYLNLQFIDSLVRVSKLTNWKNIVALCYNNIWATLHKLWTKRLHCSSINAKPVEKDTYSNQ